MPSCIARQKSSSDQAPIPVATSGRNIWTDQRSEWRLQRSAAGKRLTTRRGVAADAIAEHGEVPAALDLLERLVVFRRARGS